MLMDFFKSKFKLLGIRFDIENKTITIPSGYKIIFEGDAEILSEKNVNISSNFNEINPLTNKPYSINLNCNKDADE